jgi:hypothetical protein
MKKFFLALMFASHSMLAQNFVVEKVKITETVDKKTVSNIPRLKDLSNHENPVVSKVNSYLLEHFDLNSYNQHEIEEFRWYDVDFDAEVKSGILYLHYEGEYYGAYPNAVEEELFFDLSTGAKVVNDDIPFQALFSLQGYMDFLNTYWLSAKLNDTFKEATTCAGGTEPDCSYYDISKYNIENGKLTVSLETDCYPHAMQACNPSHSTTIPIDSLKPYLAETGKKILLQDHYSDKKGVDKFIYNKSVWKTIPNNLFLFGLINGKYPISMAITIDKTGATSGYYYYDKKKQKLTLKGSFANNILDMTETVNNAPTGKFYFTWTEKYNEEAFPIYDSQGNSKYLNGTWLSVDGSKKYGIRFTEVLATTK